MAKSGFYKATEGFSFDLPSGGHSAVSKGTIVEEAHPAYQIAPHLFEAMEPKLDRDVEQATAVPGEKRGAPRGGK